MRMISKEAAERITRRTEKLRAAYHQTDVFKYRLGRPNNSRVRRQRLSYMRSYLANERKAYTVRLRRAYAEADILLNMQPVFYEGELISGMPDHGRLTPEEQAEYDELEKRMSAAPETTTLTRGHMALDYEKLIKVGVNGLIKEVEERRAALDLNVPENLSKDEFYEGCLAELNALCVLAKRYSEAAAKLAEETENPQWAEELRVTAENVKVVPMEPARTFHQGLQCIHFYTCTLPILKSLGQSYAGGGSMQENIDAAGGPGTGAFAKAAIDIYCRKDHL